EVASVMNHTILLRLVVVSVVAFGFDDGGLDRCRGSDGEVPAASRSKKTVRIAAAQPKNRTIDFRLKPADALAQVDKSLDELEKIVHKAGTAGCDALALPEDTL